MTHERIKDDSRTFLKSPAKRQDSPSRFVTRPTTRHELFLGPGMSGWLSLRPA